MGILRSGLSARVDCEPLQIQDGSGALRSTSRRNARPRRSDAAYLRHGARRMERALRLASGTKLVRRTAVEPVSDSALAAHRRVQETHGAGGLSRRAHERSAVAGAILLAGRFHASMAL